MIRSAALPVADTAVLSNRKKYRAMRTAASKATIFQLLEARKLEARGKNK